jgi:hypothetical protein
MNDLMAQWYASTAIGSSTAFGAASNLQAFDRVNYELSDDMLFPDDLPLSADMFTFEACHPMEQPSDSGSFVAPSSPFAAMPPSRAQEGKITPEEMDVLLGRGRHNISHPGNAFFNKMIKDNMKDYTQATRPMKKRIAEDIMFQVQKKGRFIRFDSGTREWQEVEGAEVLDKIGQAIRYRHGEQGKSSPKSAPDQPRRGSKTKPTAKEPILSDKAILRAVGYDLNEETGEITPIGSNQIMLQPAHSLDDGLDEALNDGSDTASLLTFSSGGSQRKRSASGGKKKQT